MIWDDIPEYVEEEKQYRDQWEWNIPCLCGRLDRKVFHILWENKSLHKPYHLVQCNQCGLVYHDPRQTWERIMKVYQMPWAEKKYFQKHQREYYRIRHQETLSLLQSHIDIETRSLFDIGCGGGTQLLAAMERGLRVMGNEINKYSCQHLRTDYGLDVHYCPTKDLVIPNAFDLITITDYIEHTYTPKEDLKWAYDHLNTGGLLYLETLYLDSPAHKQGKEPWWYFGYGHVYYFTSAQLKKLLLDLGFDIIFETKKWTLIQLIGRK